MSNNSLNITTVTFVNLTSALPSTCTTTTDYIRTIFIYNNQHVLLTCYTNKILNILDLNLTYTGNYFATNDNPVGVYSDDGRRLLVTTVNSAGLEFFTL
jgi:hypothetical protein